MGQENDRQMMEKWVTNTVCKMIRHRRDPRLEILWKECYTWCIRDHTRKMYQVYHQAVKEEWTRRKIGIFLCLKSILGRDVAKMICQRLCRKEVDPLVMILDDIFLYMKRTMSTGEALK